ncbi:MupA/Atu3671 family FMN-dependent luciferase-like monooxygenase [Streptomyces alfalfae]|uniref:LLM class flavin-dependent oxidoreductase n=1 Tax=Streptomyces alfalfae TaxID=1642299 RepID=A0A7T4PCB7_9ACTN|nr:MupA/Atu3671 family FMN-dependent luciferase-like monooxygenase [Streptomyces alfalfae]QQC87616.1 LLM class flavin-dependent oxidoreductase [Streptomyces alfalfae]
MTPPGHEDAKSALRDRLAALSPAQRAALTERLRTRAAADAPPRRPLRFSLFYFANTAGDKEQPYRFLMETARQADRLGFAAVWTPERHFHDFGGIYPNPSVLGAALASATQNVQIRAGSLVLPLHHPVRVVEDWSVIDNLSGGRAGISFATGWHGTDFVIDPEKYADRRQYTWDTIPVVQKLWRGEEVSFPGPEGTEITPTLYPRPVTRELPFWITASGNADTYAQAGRLGANILTGLIGTETERLAANIALYRKERAAHGHDPDAGVVSVMLHTYLEEDATAARERCREPLREYLRGYLGQQSDMIGGSGADAGGADIEAQLDFAYERYAHQTALIGSPRTVRPLLDRLAEIGVDEAACLVDFGVPLERAQRSIDLLAGVQEAYAGRPAAGAASLVAPSVTSPVTTAPLGIDQERMHRMQKALPPGPANYVTTGLRIRGPLGPELLEEALRTVVARHEVLRTAFGESPSGEPFQRIGAPGEFPVRLERHDVTDVPPAERVRAARAVRTELARRPFPDDLPPVRLALITLGDEEFQLAAVKNHMVTDWVSFTVFLKELFTVYGALLRGRSPDLPPPVPYRVFAEQERARLRDGLLDDQLAYWDKQLAGAPDPATFPLKKSLGGRRPAAPTFEGHRAWMLFPDETTARLNALSRAARVTPFMTAYTALAASLGRTTGESDLVLGSPTANRDRTPDNLLGLLLRPMLLRTRLRPEQTFRDALADVRGTVSGALSHAEAPYQSLIDRLAPHRDISWTPLFRLRYLFLPWNDPFEMSGLQLNPIDTDPQTSLYDSTLTLWDSRLGAFGRFEYATDLFDHETVVEGIETFATMLAAAVADPDIRIGDLPIASSTRYHVDVDQLEAHLGSEGPPQDRR